MAKSRELVQGQGAAAEALGISRETLRKYISLGMPARQLPSSNQWEIDIAAARAWIAEKTRPAVRSTPRRAPGPETRAEAQLRKEAAIADLRELELAKARGLLIERAAVEQAVSEAFHAVRKGCLALPSRISRELAAMNDEAEIRDLIEAEVGAVLESLTVELGGEPAPVDVRALPAAVADEDEEPDAD